MLTKELGILIKSVITNNGFKYKKEIKGFSWTRKFTDKQEEIIFGYRTFYPNMFQIYRPSVSILYEKVETILGECLENNNVRNIWGLPQTIHSALHNIEGIDYSKFETKIHDDASFQVVAEEIKKIVEYGAMPFFEKYKTLEEVANLLSDKKAEEVVPYIQGAILFPKTILILKLANHSKYKEKLVEFRDVLKQQVAKKEIYKQMLLVYDDLFAEDLKELRYV